MSPDSQVNKSPAVIATPTDVVVMPVRTPEEKKAFIAYQYDIYKGHPTFVPPLLMEREDFLNPKKNPWFDHGRVEYFLARRQGQIVGRIAAIEDPRYNEFHGTRTGCFGFFECIDDVGVAKTMLEAATAWCRARGLTQVIGPSSFNSNHEFGLLVDGLDLPPCVMMPYNHSYYPKLIEAAGFVKAKDLWGWEIDIRKPVPEKIARVAEKIRQREGVVVRSANMKDFTNEVKMIKEVYNQAWEKNWGFVPMTDREFDQMAKDLKLIIEPSLALFAYVKGETLPVAFSLTLPDINFALKAANGRLTSFGFLPIGLSKLLWAKSRIKSGRIVIMGTRPGFRKRGLDAILMLDTVVNARKLGWWGGEISWTLEDNDMVNRCAELFGCKKYKTYRVYEKPTGAAPPMTN
jgi:GNAT superfamily N-acetyltransferase